MARDGTTTAFGVTRQLGLAAVALIFVTTAAGAQNAATQRGSGNDSVIVDLSVLDSLRPGPADPSRPRGTVRLIPPADFTGPRNNSVRLQRPGGAPASAPPRLTSAPPPPPSPELLGGAVPPPPAATTAPAAKVSPAETARTEAPKAAPTSAKSDPPPAPPPPAPSTANAGKTAPDVPPPPLAALPAPEKPAPPARTQIREKAPAPAPAVAAPPVQAAAMPKVPKPPTASGFAAGATRAIAYAAGKAELPGDAQATLQAAAASLKADPALRIQLKAYAAGSKDSESRARRLSLSRALGVRSFLIKQGIEPTRIDVRALGNNVPDGPADRVDVSLVAR